MGGICSPPFNPAILTKANLWSSVRRGPRQSESQTSSSATLADVLRLPTLHAHALSLALLPSGSLLLLPQSGDREVAAGPAPGVAGGAAGGAGEGGDGADLRDLQGKTGAEPVRRGGGKAAGHQERAAEPEAIVSDAVRLFDDLYGKAALDELDRRWAEFERTGESYTQEEVETWLNTWGTRDYRPFRPRQ